MSTHLYHFTSSAQLPRIVRSGELRPAVFVGQPPDFVHATNNENGERTAAGWWTWEKDYRAGTIRRVRFTLAAGDFEPWLTVLARYPNGHGIGLRGVNRSHAITVNQRQAGTAAPIRCPSPT
jgi:hypothetical protein